MYCTLMSFSDMFRAQGFNQEAFAHTIQDIYLLRVVLVIFQVIFLTGLFGVDNRGNAGASLGQPATEGPREGSSGCLQGRGRP